MGFGLPFSGTSEHCKNEKAPVTAIVILEKAKENELIKCDKLFAFKKIYSECIVNCWNKEFTDIIINEILDLVENVDVYMLRCRKDKSSVETLSNELERRGKI